MGIPADKQKKVKFMIFSKYGKNFTISKGTLSDLFLNILHRKSVNDINISLR